MNNMNINYAIADTLDIGNTDTEKKTGLIGFYNYTVVLTYIGMWIGFLGVMLAIKDRYVGSLICLCLLYTSQTISLMIIWQRSI